MAPSQIIADYKCSLKFSSHTAVENCLFKQIISKPIQNQSFCTLVVSKLKIYISQKGDNYRFLLQNLHKSKLGILFVVLAMPSSMKSSFFRNLIHEIFDDS